MLNQRQKNELREALDYLSNHVHVKVSIGRARLIYDALNGNQADYGKVTLNEAERFINQQTLSAFIRVNRHLIDLSRDIKKEILSLEKKGANI